MYATQEYIDMVTIGLSAQTGINIKPGENWGVDIKNKTLYYVPETLRNLPFEIVRGFLLHEIGHIHFTDVIETLEPSVAKYPHAMPGIYNAFEDLRIEQKLKGKYGDYAGNALTASNYYAVITKEQQTNRDFTKMSKVNQFIHLALFEHLYHANDYLRYSYFDAKKYMLDKEVEKRYRQCWSELGQFTERCQWLRSTQSLQTDVNNIFIPMVKDWLEEEEEQAKQNAQGQGGGEEGGEGQSKGKPQTASGSIMEQMMNDIKKHGGMQHSLGHKVNPPPIIKPTEAEALGLLRPYASTLANRLRDILIEKISLRYTGNTKSGKLLNRNAYKAVIPNESRIFSRKNNPDTVMYDIHVALDSSGSMASQGRGVYAFLGTVLLKDVARRLNFPINIVAYDDKAWELEKMDDYTANGGGTDDWVALQAIDKKIQPERENLVFVITDGETERNGNFDKYRKSLEDKGAHVFGVGIGEGVSKETMIQNYPNALYVPDVKNLPAELIRTLRMMIHR